MQLNFRILATKFALVYDSMDAGSVLFLEIVCKLVGLLLYTSYTTWQV